MPRRTNAQLTPTGRVVVGGGAALLVVALGVTAVLTLRADGPLAPDSCSATVNGTTVELSPEQMGNAATIAGISQRRGLPARAATIGIATAMQESKLVNISYGDRDSLGLFQQRPSQGWGTKRQVQDPVYATNAFYDVLVKVQGYRSLPITKAAQKVQRSAFPEAYAQHEPEARVLASALTGYSAAALTCTLRDTAPAGSGGLRALRAALKNEQATVALTQSTAGSGLRLTPRPRGANPDNAALAWSLAQWSVGQADRLGVARVYADGRMWRRAAADDGWREVHGAGVPTSGSREVVVMLTDTSPA